MFEKLQQALLPLLRVPPQPAPPFGALGSIRVFRAGRNFYKFKLFIWGIGQLATVAGIVFSLGILSRLKSDADAIRQERIEAAQARATAAAQAERGRNDQLCDGRPERIGRGSKVWKAAHARHVLA